MGKTYVRPCTLSSDISDWRIWGRYFTAPVIEADGSFTYTVLIEYVKPLVKATQEKAPARVGQWYRLNTKNWRPERVEVNLI